MPRKWGAAQGFLIMHDGILTSSPEVVRPQRRLPAWQRALRDAVRDPRELCRVLHLPAEIEAAAVRAAQDFPLLVPRGYLARIRPGDPYDPLLRQVLPLHEELARVPGFTADPVGEADAALAPGLLQKYHARALMVTTGACAVHCRYCFRRHYPYSDGPSSLVAWEPALEKIAAETTFDEVLLSGGDPLTLVDDRLAALVRRLDSIAHLRRLRLHTRLPIVLPERVCDEMLDWLCGTRLAPIVVVHANHPAEVDQAVAEALRRLVEAGAVVLNQSVLLRGVNDDADVLVELCRRLVDLRVMPYYLHQLDRVQGAAHFEVEEVVGVRLAAEMRARLPGYAVPRYVREMAGEKHKLVLA
jgi:EF-P beta-lysylation protein EpmB